MRMIGVVVIGADTLYSVSDGDVSGISSVVRLSSVTKPCVRSAPKRRNYVCCGYVFHYMCMCASSLTMSIEYRGSKKVRMLLEVSLLTATKIILRDCYKNNISSK